MPVDGNDDNTLVTVWNAARILHDMVVHGRFWHCFTSSNTSIADVVKIETCVFLITVDM